MSSDAPIDPSPSSTITSDVVNSAPEDEAGAQPEVVGGAEPGEVGGPAPGGAVGQAPGGMTGQPSAGPSLPWRVRPAQPQDLARIDALVRELAQYEREPHAVVATVEDFGAALFNPHPRVHCHVVEVSGSDGALVVGIAIWYVTFSTWRGRHGLWLEDLYVQPGYRRLGAGRGLLAELASLCVDRGYARLEWWVLDWNEPAHRFYRQVGAHPEDDWTVWRVDGRTLETLARPVT